MKNLASLLLVAICLQIFCLPVQQSYGQGRSDAVSTDILDSDAYFPPGGGHALAYKIIRHRSRLCYSKMTIEEKVGQMTQLRSIRSRREATRTSRSTRRNSTRRSSNTKSARSSTSRATLSRSINGTRSSAPFSRSAQKTRLKIPVIYGIDSIHGANYVQGATLFPQEIGMAASWNPALMQRAAEITAMETRAAGIPWSFSPVLDVGRQPLWPRFWETFGEDPYLATVMGTAFVRGLEGDNVAAADIVAASLKHYVGYSFPLTGRDRTPAWIPENYLREYFLPHVRGGGESRGAHGDGQLGGDQRRARHINKHLLTDVLKGELGFDGFIVSDWEDIRNLSLNGMSRPTKKKRRAWPSWPASI